MSPLPLIPAAPASSGPGLRDVPAGKSAPSTGRDGGGSSFEDVLTRSAAEEKPRDPSEQQEEAVEDAGLVCAPQAQQPLVILQPAEPDLQFASAGLDAGLMEAAVVDTAPAESVGVEGASVLIQGGLSPWGQPTPEQPLPISKPLAQAAFQTPAPVSLPASISPAVQGPEGITPQDLVGSDAAGSLPVLGDLDASEGGALPTAVLVTEGLNPSVDPAKDAGPRPLAAPKPSAEQITVPAETRIGDQSAESAVGLDSRVNQSPVQVADGAQVAPKRPISTGRVSTGTDGADADPAMSAALLQPSRTAASQKNPREAVGVFGGAVLEEFSAADEFSEPAALPDLAGGFVSRVSDVPVQSQSVQIPAGAPQAPVAHADAARVLEHLEMTLAKYRPNVPPHLEVKVDLQGGDTLQVRLDLRGDALQSTFRTDSPELRMALQRAWPEFMERSQQNGLNLSPASFDSPGMSSDSGAGSQADGRRQGSGESEGPLPEAFRKVPSQFARKSGEPALRNAESAQTRWA